MLKPYLASCNLLIYSIHNIGKTRIKAVHKNETVEKFIFQHNNDPM